MALHSRFFTRALNATRNSANRARLLRAPPAARWLLVTDSVSLKLSAQASWARERLRSTVAVPAHVMCSQEAASQQRSMLETLGELLLLSECDVLVHGRSRFPLSALYLGSTCRQALRLDVESDKCIGCSAGKLPRNSRQERTAAGGHLNNKLPAGLSNGCVRLLGSPWACRRSEVSGVDGGKNVSYYTVAQELFASGEWSYDTLQ